MELTTNLQKSDQFKFLKSRNSSLSPKPEYLKNDLENGIIDVSKINFSNNETWLCSVPSSNEYYVENLHKWLNLKTDNDVGTDLEVGSPKNIDTRTFTRPKKRFTRPSIEKYNDEVYGKTHTNVQNLVLNDNIIQESSEPISSNQPLMFDLSQPTNNYSFENILGNSSEIDYFQNMSPPSLVNSMCSSTFANLMESSFIKNDPILREIRDTDYTNVVLLQDCEPPMFQSITESCSSINSDTAEHFLRKISFNGTYKDSSKYHDKTVENSCIGTVEENNSSTTIKEIDQTPTLTENVQQMSNFNGTCIRRSKECNSTFTCPDSRNEMETFNSTFEVPSHGTYIRKSKQHNGTFTKSDNRNKTEIINSTFEVSPNEIKMENTNQTFKKDSNIKRFHNNNVFDKIAIDDLIGEGKKELSDPEQITDLNRLSYFPEDENIKLDSGYVGANDNLNTTQTIKRSSIGCSSGSVDSLDRMSSFSTSSKGSNPALNMADVDLIAEMQEKTLQQQFSTPHKPATKGVFRLSKHFSPILNEHISDSDASSNEEYKSVKSAASDTSLSKMSTKAKSLGYLAGPTNMKINSIHRSTFTLASRNPLPAVHNKIPSLAGSNLKNMGPKLKGSYTSLRPMSANLPVAPPINTNSHTTTVVRKAENPNVKHNIAQNKKVDDKDRYTFAKPSIPKASGLPRPTGIPRPSSRLPAPRTSKARPASSKPTFNRPGADF